MLRVIYFCPSESMYGDNIALMRIMPYLVENGVKPYFVVSFEGKFTQYLKEHNYDYFTTTLSISPYKVSAWINEIGSTLEKKYNIKYLYADFKKKNGYKRSLELSAEYGLYRQNYCGCKYSMEARNIQNKKED